MKIAKEEIIKYMRDKTRNRKWLQQIQMETQTNNRKHIKNENNIKIIMIIEYTTPTTHTHLLHNCDIRMVT